MPGGRGRQFAGPKYGNAREVSSVLSAPRLSGGLFAAHLLSSIGWDVQVFERSAGDLASRGAGIGATDALCAVMQRVGVPLDASYGSDTRIMI